MLSYPDQLFNARIVDGSNLRLFCEASSTSSSLTMTWTINGNTITDNHPRIRQTRATIGEKTLFTLAVDNFMIIDAGSYSCSARIGSTTRQGNTFALSCKYRARPVLQVQLHAYCTLAIARIYPFASFLAANTPLSKSGLTKMEVL